MKRVFQLILATIVAIACQTFYSAQGAAMIEGVVIDATSSQPLGNVQVALWSTGTSPIASAITDAQGHFTLETTQSGRFRVAPTRNGYIYSYPGQTHVSGEPGIWIQVSSGNPLHGLELRMALPGSISGRVLKSDGQPLVGNAGSVALQRYTYGSDGKRTLGWVPGISYAGAGGSFQRTDDRGQFRLYDLPPGEYYLTVSGGGGAIGAPNVYFYPGVSDESKAVPIRVKGGDDIQVGTLSLPSRQIGTSVTLHLKNSTGAGGKQVYIGDNMLVLTALNKPDELVLPPIVQGHFDIVVTSRVRPFAVDYATVSLEVGATALDKELELKPGATISGTLMVEDASGKRSIAPSSIQCRLRSHYGLYNCSGAQVVPAAFEIELDGLSTDEYVLSVKENDRDALVEGLNIVGDTNIQIVLVGKGGAAQGTVRDTAGNTLPDAVVALVPDAPYRKTGVLYRKVISDPNGKFEIHGIGPGAYKLFAWAELEGAGYRNADFMKEFDERGQHVMFEKESKVSIDLIAF